MPRLLLLLAIALAIYMAYQWLQKQPAKQRKVKLWQIAAWSIAGLLLLLVVTGRIPLIGAIFAAILPLAKRLSPLLLRALPFLHQQYKQNTANQASDSQKSSVNTDIIALQLDHDSGQITGQVLDGPHSGQQLDQLSQAELEQVWLYCQKHDQESTQLLATYLQHRLGDDWGFIGNKDQYSTQTNRNMEREEALQVLGLPETATKEEIKSAHRRLIQKLHPDRGGSDYLAAQINLAKECLLKD
ncbi:MAG: DnaJ domain-containing protein [Pseudomonadales bacterium]